MQSMRSWLDRSSMILPNLTPVYVTLQANIVILPNLTPVYVTLQANIDRADQEKTITGIMMFNERVAR